MKASDAAGVRPKYALRRLLEGLGNKWSYLLILELAASPLPLGEICRLIPDISQSALTDTLRTLQRDGIIECEALSTKPDGMQYRLTPLGESLLETVRQLERWAIDSKSSILRHRALFDEGSEPTKHPIRSGSAD